MWRKYFRVCLIVPTNLRLNAIGYSKIRALKTVINGLVKLRRKLLVVNAKNASILSKAFTCENQWQYYLCLVYE